MSANRGFPAPCSDDDAVALLRSMLEISSLSRHESALAGFLVARMTEWGFAASLDAAGNAVGVRGGEFSRARAAEIVLLGHLDTVPGDIPVRVHDEAIYGRGAVDAKGPLAALLLAAARAQFEQPTRLIVVGAVEEETATSRGARAIAERLRPDACVIGEPSGWAGCTLGYKGRALLNYRGRRPAAHSAGPETTACERACRWWQTIAAFAEQFNAGRRSLFGQLLPSLLRIASNNDGLVDEVHATVSLRLPPDVDRGAVEACGRAGLEPSESVEVSGYEPAFRAPRTSWLAQAFARAIAESGGRPDFKLKTGTSDMNVVGPVWNCPIVAYGPGDSGLDHTPHEHLPLDEFLRAIRVLTRALERAAQQLAASRSG